MERTEIDELIEAAKAQQKKWRKPSNEPKLTNRSMQEILEGKGYDPKQVSYIASRPGGI
ncbi:hypothetical protein ES708_15432 [subsurface metagenome]